MTRRLQRERELAYYTAYHAGVFSQTYDKGKFPRYEQHRPKPPRPGAGTPQAPLRGWEEQYAAFAGWAASFRK